MKYLKTFESEKGSDDFLTSQEVDQIDNVVKEYLYILTDEGWGAKMFHTPRPATISLSQIYGHQSFSKTLFAYRILVYKQPGTPFEPLMQFKEHTISSDEFNEFIDRVQNELGDDYLVHNNDNETGLIIINIDKKVK